MTAPWRPLSLAVRRRLAHLGDQARRRAPALKRVPPLATLLEWAARVGYGARGFVYLSIGVVAFLAANELLPSATGSSGAAAMIANQPLGRVWLILLGLGLWAFVGWRVLQSVFDVDHEGLSARGLGLRAGQAMSGVFYAVLAASTFELLDEAGEADPDDQAEARDQAAAVLDMPFGDWLLIVVGAIILAIGIGNVIKGLRADFGADLGCGQDVCRRVVPIARAGYVARGLAYLPLGVFVILAGVKTQASEARSFGASLNALEAQPFGSFVLGATALGLVAFGAFAFVEARWRRIRVPADLEPGL